MIHARARIGAADLRGPSRHPEYSAVDLSALVVAMYKSTRGFTGDETVGCWKEAYANRVWMTQRARIRTEPDDAFLDDLVGAGVLHLWTD